MVQLGIGTTQVHCAYPSVRHPEGNPVGPERQDSPAPTWVLAPQPSGLEWDYELMSTCSLPTATGRYVGRRK